MLEFIQYGFALILFGAGSWVVWESSKMIDEKNKRRRAGLTDYYDNPIERNKSSKCMGGEDE